MAENIELPEGFDPDEFVKKYLLDNPEYFRSHSDVFCKLVPPRQNREGTRSIIECQNEVLRASLTTYEIREEEIATREKALETAQKGLSKALLDLSISIVSLTKDYEIPETLLKQFKRFFKVEHGIIRLWLYRSEFEGQPFTKPFSEEVESEISEMPETFIGENLGSEIASWFEVPVSQTRGVILIPVKAPNGITFGAICLASSDVSTFKGPHVQHFLSGALPIAQAALLRLTR